MGILGDYFEILMGTCNVSVNSIFTPNGKSLYMLPNSLIVNKEEGVRELQNYKITAQIGVTNKSYDRHGIVFGYRKSSENGGVTDSFYSVYYYASPVNKYYIRKHNNNGSIETLNEVSFNSGNFQNLIPSTLELFWANGNYEFKVNGSLVLSGSDSSFEKGGWGFITGSQGTVYFDNVVISDLS